MFLIEIEEIKTKIEKVVSNGQFFLLKPYLEHLLNNTQKYITIPCFIKITQDFRIFVNENTEIKLPHLTKSIYLFFLKKNEEISLSELHHYKQEILNFYKQISYKNSVEDLEKSVETLVKTKLIYVHFSRIKKAFYDALPFYLAKNCIIIGEKNCPKYIQLERKYVIWEEKQGL